jgi:hypothetical protein
LPVGETEAALELFADPQRVFGREHKRDALADAPRDGFGDDFRRVASHSSGVAKAEVDVFAAVHISEVGAMRGLHEDGERTGPFFHPVHGDAAEERMSRALIEFAGAGMVGGEALGFGLVELAEFGAIDGSHRQIGRRNNKPTHLTGQDHNGVVNWKK